MNGRNGLLAAALLLAAAPAFSDEISFYEAENFRGRVFSTDTPVQNLNRTGFNGRASSVIVESGRWEVCEEARFGGRCTLLRRGSYDSLERMGINNRISSVRPADGRGNRRGGRDSDDRSSGREMEPLAEPNYQYRRRSNERLSEVPVTSVRAVVGSPEQRCWIEREQVSDGAVRGKANIGGAIAGAIIGGILGHQVGSGRGNDAATAGGALAGGAIGSQVGRGSGGGTYERDVERCERVADRTPEYWDVTYTYRGQEHRVQMTSPPGRTILVNRDGEPRA
ncbi:MAG TPA: beta/gamma crystallin-related protein [Steroidobacteraceae bacterium]|nr:beta/gamma crystallin-related protein [Steroidobacteraceae bacterium]